MAHQCQRGISIDGRLDEPCWAAASSTDAFVDIVGSTGPKPWVQTSAKMLWDSSHLYIAAELQDPSVFAYETKHDR